MFCVDLAPFYPDSIRPQFMNDIRTFYIETYHDRFFSSPPAWFTMYLWLELLYHVPLSFWAVGALLRGSLFVTLHAEYVRGNGSSLCILGDPKVPAHLLVFAVQTALTTSTCIADYLSWSGYSNAEKIELGKLYVPYLALSVFMGVDMWTRLIKSIGGPSKAGRRKGD
ncbi:hypothetical protein D0863_05949 [Hortaea werneckii]|uniref:Efficient mitochondria targeting-associated protein 19 n=1 Tax=Hortaea werneckii TaxID=91943 RepID=A0A3M7E2E1_HORWE|nr:hypothetical protein D0863_05949 [Hortaea werneckii]